MGWWSCVVFAIYFLSGSRTEIGGGGGGTLNDPNLLLAKTHFEGEVGGGLNVCSGVYGTEHPPPKPQLEGGAGAGENTGVQQSQYTFRTGRTEPHRPH